MVLILIYLHMKMVLYILSLMQQRNILLTQVHVFSRFSCFIKAFHVVIL